MKEQGKKIMETGKTKDVEVDLEKDGDKVVGGAIIQPEKGADTHYTLAVEASKRARKIVGGNIPMNDTSKKKPLNVAEEEIDKGAIKIIQD